VQRLAGEFCLLSAPERLVQVVAVAILPWGLRDGDASHLVPEPQPVGAVNVPGQPDGL
jgi:hypothetical protein